LVAAGILSRLASLSRALLASSGRLIFILVFTVAMPLV
jgi:hypothetical protein